eukprot:scaffold27446_cov37-Phaeocystis_antarctica.AAC.1
MASPPVRSSPNMSANTTPGVATCEAEERRVGEERAAGGADALEHGSATGDDLVRIEVRVKSGLR